MLLWPLDRIVPLVLVSDRHRHQPGSVAVETQGAALNVTDATQVPERVVW